MRAFKLRSDQLFERYCRFSSLKSLVQTFSLIVESTYLSVNLIRNHNLTLINHQFWKRRCWIALILSWSNKALKNTLVNWTSYCINWQSIEIISLSDKKTGKTEICCNSEKWETEKELLNHAILKILCCCRLICWSTRDRGFQF